MTTSRVLVEKYGIGDYGIEYNPIDATWDVYKKPKRVKVLVDNRNIGDGYWAVRFKIVNWSGGKFIVYYTERDFGWNQVQVDSHCVRTTAAHYTSLHETSCPLYIGGDAQDKWSAPVIFNREQREKLQDLCKYLEEKLNAPS